MASLLLALWLAIGGIAATAAAETRTVKLPSEVDEVCLAGRGDFVLLRLPKVQKLAVFDVATEKLVGYAPLGGADTLITGTADGILLLARDKKVLQRWSLSPLEKKLTVTVPITAEIDGLVAGYASKSPALVMTRQGPQFVDVTSLKVVQIEGKFQGMGWSPHPQYPILVTASADGSTFSGFVPGLSPSGIRTLRLQGNRATEKYEHQSVGAQIPSADGSLLFTASGVYNADLKPLDRNLERRMFTFPTVHPAYYVGYAPSDRGGDDGKGTFTLFTAQDRVPLVTLDDVSIKADNLYGGRGAGLSLAERVIVHPAKKKLLVIDDQKTAIRVSDFDVVGALNAKGIDYLFVETLPVTSAEPGQKYTYKIGVLSKAGKVKFELESGPTGMTITPDGVLTWAVPRSGADAENGVIVSIADGSGQSVFHTFTVLVAQPPEPRGGRTPATRPTSQ
jgi:hypothetical protein